MGCRSGLAGLAARGARAARETDYWVFSRCPSLTFFAKVGLELSEYAQHVEEGLPRGSACIHQLLGGLQAGTLGFYGANNTCANSWHHYRSRMRSRDWI